MPLFAAAASVVALIGVLANWPPTRQQVEQIQKTLGGRANRGTDVEPCA